MVRIGLKGELIFDEVDLQGKHWRHFLFCLGNISLQLSLFSSQFRTQWDELIFAACKP